MVFRGATSINCTHSQNNGVSAHSLERSSMEQINFFGVFPGCDNMGDDGYLKDMPLIWGIFIPSFLKPEIQTMFDSVSRIVRFAVRVILASVAFRFVSR